MRKPVIFAFIIAAIGVGFGGTSAKTKKTKDLTFTSKINKATLKPMISTTPPGGLSPPAPPAGPLPMPYPNVGRQGSAPGRTGTIRGTGAVTPTMR